MSYGTERLKEKRHEFGLTIYDMAEKLQMSASFYSQIENKKRRLFYDTALRIAAIFNLKPDDLFYVEDQELHHS